MVSLDRCGESYNNFEDPVGIICVSNKIENLNLKVFNMMKEIGESSILIKCECRCKFDERK